MTHDYRQDQKHHHLQLNLLKDRHVITQTTIILIFSIKIEINAATHRKIAVCSLQL